MSLLLWGVSMVRTGITRAFGPALRQFISRATSNRIKAFFAGIGVTALLQSSTATALIIASFAQKGLIPVTAGFAVMLGADVGTTLVAQLLSMDVHFLAPLLLMVGVVINGSVERGKWKHLSRAIVGLGLMLVSLGMIVSASTPLRESDALEVVLSPLTREPLLAVALAALLTWMAHSSLAVVLLFMSLASTGSISVPLALTLVLGANIGGAFAPVMATAKGSREGARVPIGNLLMRFSGVVILFPLLDSVMPLIEQFDPDPARQIVNFHTAFNFFVALLFLPLINPVAACCARMMPAPPEARGEIRPRYLDETALDSPTVALSAAARETLYIGDVVESMLRKSIRVFDTNDDKLLHEIQKKDNTVDILYNAVKLYLTQVSSEALDPQESDRYIQILSFVTNLEHVGDVIDKNLMELAEKKIRTQQTFSAEGAQEIEEFHRRVLTNIRLALNVFMSGDVMLARQLLESKNKLRDMEIKATNAHLERLREGRPETVATTDIHLDILRDLRRINSYVSSIGYLILEDTGHLRSSRLKKVKSGKRK